jgi:hypothetical protein
MVSNINKPAVITVIRLSSENKSSKATRFQKDQGTNQWSESKSLDSPSPVLIIREFLSGPVRASKVFDEKKQLACSLTDDLNSKRPVRTFKARARKIFYMASLKSDRAYCIGDDIPPYRRPWGMKTNRETTVYNFVYGDDKLISLIPACEIKSRVRSLASLLKKVSNPFIFRSNDPEKIPDEILNEIDRIFRQRI